MASQIANSNLHAYIQNINRLYVQGRATEHSYRGDLAQLIEAIVPEIKAINEPKRQACGAPDYILERNQVPIGFIEAKDVGDKDLEGAKKAINKEQFDRYKASLDNLIFTDYVHFHLYQNGEFVSKIAIGEITDRGIVALPQQFETFENLLKDFCTHVGQHIRSAKKLAQLMAGKARLLSDIIGKALLSDEENHENSTLKEQYEAFKQILIHDITPEGFADVYAQTIAYGMFAARLHDPTLENFNRQEAAELIPKTNPFLRKLFGYIAGPDIDDRIKWVVENLSDIFLACNVEEILKNYGKSTKMEDPIIHFYETFLAEYDPKLRKARGVWYTPQPVVDFIVRAVDDILKTEFDLPQGLADTTKVPIKVNAQGKKVEKEVHRVQILDPATGTGTFLAEVIKHIYKGFTGQQGLWSNYVENHLLPRLNGFELLMASYAMAHLKLDLLLTETKFAPTTLQRFRVYLTNSLEAHHPDTGTLFANWLSTEANEANHIKRDTPVMCVIGNPPYSGISSNNGKWIKNLIEDYKYVDGVHFNERKHWLNDDYVKFIRYGQHYIEKNGSGVLAFINPHGFLDNPTFRGMRWNLLKTYDKIYTIDLHGNSKKKETAPDGSPDQNVFDIMQGVSINIFVKIGKKFPSSGGVSAGRGGQLGKVFHYDLYGKREFKYDFLSKKSLKSVDFVQLKYNNPYYFFIPKDEDGRSDYEKGFDISSLFTNSTTGIVTMGDGFIIADTKEELKSRINDFKSNQYTEDELKKIYSLGKNYAKWILDNRNNLEDNIIIAPIDYRPFDNKFTVFDGQLVWRLREKTTKHIISNGLALVFARQTTTDDWSAIQVVGSMIDNRFHFSYKGIPQQASLYLYPETNGQKNIGQEAERVPNLNAEIVNQIAENLGLTFTSEKFPSSGGVADVGGRGGRNTQNYMKLPYNPKLKERARTLRKAGNLSEVLFWKQVRNKQFKGFDFDRQKIIGNYIVDFFCTNCNVVIEIDGSSHDDKVEYDAERDTFLESLGLTVIHIPDLDVKKNMSGVMEMLYNHPALKEPPLEALQEKTTPLAFGEHPSKGGESSSFAPIDILDYIYAVLHSPSYREKYKEFLKIDFPRVPYPKDATTFWQLVKLGGELRQIHLLESPTVNQFITTYPIDGSNTITRKLTKTNIGYEPKNDTTGKVWINDEQFFDNVPKIAWEFYIGGYQPAQKWLKDRKGRTLSYEDILHYQKIIVALSETDRLMREIDKIEIEYD